MAQQWEVAFMVKRSQEKVYWCWVNTAYSAQALTPDPAPSNAPGTRNQPHEFPWSQAGTGWPFKCAPPMPDTSPKKIILACKSTLGLEAGTCSWGHNLLLCSHPTNRTLFKCFIYFKSFFFMFVFIWLGQVLAMALGNLHSFLQHVWSSFLTRDWTPAPALGTWGKSLVYFAFWLCWVSVAAQAFL